MPDLERLAGAVMGQIRARLELLSVEWQEEKIRLGGLLLAMMFVLFFAQLALVLAVLGLVVAFWDSPLRLTVVAASAALCGVGAFVSYRRLRGGLSGRHRLFEASVAELRRDEAVLEKRP